MHCVNNFDGIILIWCHCTTPFLKHLISRQVHVQIFLNFHFGLFNIFYQSWTHDVIWKCFNVHMMTENQSFHYTLATIWNSAVSKNDTHNRNKFFAESKQFDPKKYSIFRHWISSLLFLSAEEIYWKFTWLWLNLIHMCAWFTIIITPQNERILFREFIKNLINLYEYKKENKKNLSFNLNKKKNINDHKIFFIDLHVI